MMISGVVLVPLYLRFIPEGLYGAWLATGNVLTWLTAIDPGLSTVLQQRVAVAYGRGDTSELNAMLTGGILLSAVIALLVLLAGFACSGFFITWLRLSPSIDAAQLKLAFLIAIAGSAIMIFSFGFTAVNLGMQSSLGIGLIYTCSVIGGLALKVALLYKGWGLLAIAFGVLFQGLALTAGNGAYLLWRYLCEKIHYRFSLRGCIALSKLTSYTFLGRIATVGSTNCDAFALTRYLGAEIAPVFVFTRKAADLGHVIINRPSAAFMPAVSHLVGTGEIDKARVYLLRLIRMLLWLTGLVAVGVLTFNHEFVALWVGSKYFAGFRVSALISLWLVAVVTVNSTANLCFSLGNIKGNGIITSVQGLLSIPLIIIGAKYWGLIGVAVASLGPALLISTPYYPRRLMRLLRIERKEVLTLSREVLTVAAVGALIWLVFRGTFPKTWGAFTLTTMAFSLAYFSILAGLSVSFREELLMFIRRKKFRLLPGRSANRSTD